MPARPVEAGPASAGTQPERSDSQVTEPVGTETPDWITVGRQQLKMDLSSADGSVDVFPYQPPSR
jgi:hypothetical protein